MINLKLRELIFPKYFLLNEIDLPPSAVSSLLDYDIEIQQMGEPDQVIVRGNRIIYHNPSSPMKFLFQLLYSILSPKLADERFKDKLGLALIGMCRDHVYSDWDRAHINGPPVLISFEKMDVPQFLLAEIMEPLIGRVKRMPIFFFPCKFTDVCRIVEDREQLSDEYNLSYHVVPVTEFPIILSNFNIHNNAARTCHLITTVLKSQYPKSQYRAIIRSLLTDPSSRLLPDVITVLKTLRSDPLFTLNFLKYLNSEIDDPHDRLKSEELQCDIVTSDSFLSRHVKIADFGNPVGNQGGQVFRQWTQWSMMLGLTEKQLTPMRGSMWPASENLKPFEEQKKQMVAEREKAKGGPLNFEELLEVARDVYNHKAKPGSLIETLLADNRVWKA
jgi:hypothetical protein